MSKQLIRKATMAASVALAFAIPTGAHALQGVHFDADGSGGAASATVVSDFDWGAGHVLYQGCFGTAAAGTPGTSCTIYAQGSISAIVKSGGGNLSIPAGIGYTFTLVKTANASASATYDGFTPTLENITFTDNGLHAGDLFTIYRNGTGSSQPSTTPDPLNGTGYVGAASDIILQGTVSVTTFAVTNTGTANQNLDQRGSNDFPGLGTLATNGTPTFSIEVTSKNDAYFTDPLALFLVTIGDANQTDNSASPFKNTDPSKSVVGQPFSAAIVGTDGRSDIYCGTNKATGAGPCSAEFQGDALTSFQTEVVPEPGMLALLGIGLGGLGVSLRRRKSTNAA